MTEDPRDIAKDTIDALCKFKGFNPEEVYRLVNTLGKDTELSNVRLSISKAGLYGYLELCIQADYIGEERLSRQDSREKVERFFKRLSERTEVHFPSVRACYHSRDPGEYKTDLIGAGLDTFSMYISQPKEG